MIEKRAGDELPGVKRIVRAWFLLFRHGEIHREYHVRRDAFYHVHL